MVRRLTRRSILGAFGAGLGTLALGPQSVTATASDERFLVDTRSTDPDLGDARVVHDLSAIDALAIETADPSGIDVRHAPDVSFDLELPVTTQELGATPAGIDELSDLQWDKRSQRVADAHGVTDGDGTRVAVIDTGVAPDHPDLRHAVDAERSRNFTDDGGDFTDVMGHGTHVSGIIAGGDRSGRGVLGTAPATDLVACRVFTGRGTARFGAILAAMVYSARIEADAVNMSLGAYPLPLADTDVQFLLDLLNRATAVGRQHDTVFVAAAGNAGVDLDTDGLVVSLPTEAANVVSVSATGPIGFRWDDDGDDGDDDPLDDLTSPPSEPAYYTNYGEQAIDVSAPGGNVDRDAMDTDRRWFYDLVFSSLPSGYGWLAGTSMAAPQVTAAAALVRSRYPDLDAPGVRRHLRETADGASAQQYHGDGHLDTHAAVTEEVEFRTD